MNNKYVKITFFIILSILISCKGNKQCPPFDRELLVWIPYEKDDTIKFVNTENDTIMFRVSEISIFDDLSKYKYGCFSEYSCLFVLDVNNSMYYKIINECEDCVTLNLGIALNEKNGSFAFNTNNFETKITKDTIIGNQNYSNIIMLSVDTVKYPNLSHYWKIIIAKNKGIVKFYDRIDNEVWTYIE